MNLTGATTDRAADRRLASVEQNLFGFFRGIGPSLFDAHAEPDVFWFTSDVAFPLFNGALGARFEPGHAVRRTHATVDRLMDHGNPFMWWMTPSTRSPEIESSLLERGLLAEGPDLGMHVDLRGHPALEEVPPARVTVTPAAEEELEGLALAVLDGFGMPHDLLDPVRGFLGAPSGGGAQMLNVIAKDDGHVVGGGSVVVTGQTAGLYNIAVREEARGRGVGRAITAGLMRVGAEHGCIESILHSSPMGLPVYTRLGFQPVGEIVQYVWPGSP